MQDTPILIYSSRTKTLGFLVLMVLFVLAAIWMWNDAEDFDRWPPVVTRIVAVAGLVLFGSGSIIMAFSLVKRRATLRIDETGLTIGQWESRAMFVPWEQVRLFRVERNFIVVELVDVKAYIAAQTKPSRRRMLEFNHKTIGYVVGIPHKTLEVSSTELEGILNNALRKYGSPFSF